MICNVFTHVPPVLRQYLIVFIVNLNVVTTGMNIAWPSPMLVKLRNPEETPLSRPITEEEGAWIVSLGALCSSIITLFVGPLLDSVGRKNCIILSSVPKIFASLLFVLATEVWMVVVGQSMMLMANCLVLVVTPVYVSEVASKEKRGSLGTIIQISSSVGIVIMLVSAFASYSTSNIFLLMVTAVSTVPLFWLPDSPYFLHSKGRVHEANDVLTFLRGSEIMVKKELEEYSLLKNDVQVDKLRLFTSKTYIKAQLLALIIVAGAQLMGQQVVFFYLQTIFESTKTSVKPEVASVVIGAVQLFAAFCIAFVTDKFGRKQILVVSLVGVFIGLIGLGTFFQITATDGYEITGFMNYLPVISLVVYFYCYSAGVGTLSLLLASELFEGATRAMGVSISMMCSLVVIFVMGRYFAAVTAAIGAALTFWSFAFNCALVCLLLAFFLPETRGRSFAEIQDQLRGNAADVEKQ